MPGVSNPRGENPVPLLDTMLQVVLELFVVKHLLHIASNILWHFNFKGTWQRCREHHLHSELHSFKKNNLG